MKTMIKSLGVLVAVTLVGSTGMAQYHGGGHGYGDGRGGRGGYHGYDGGHYGYYHNSRGELIFGLLGLGLLAVAVSEQPVYVQPAPIIYQTPPVVYLPQPVQPPTIVYVQQPEPVQQPQTLYQGPPVVQQPAQTGPKVVQQPVAIPQPIPVMEPHPMTITINIQNSNGSFTPVTLRQAGTWWIGPRGESYRDGVPSVGQLRPLYGR